MNQHAPDVLVAIGVTEKIRLRLARIALDLTQKDLARLAEVPQCEVSALERSYRIYPAARGRIMAVPGLEDAA